MIWGTRFRQELDDSGAGHFSPLIQDSHSQTKQGVSVMSILIMYNQFKVTDNN
jgi:hypothetical protein